MTPCTEGFARRDWLQLSNIMLMTLPDCEFL